MGIVRFEGDPPYELLLAKGGKAKAEDESVIVTLPVFSPGHEQDGREIQVVMRFGHAIALSHRLRAAGEEARNKAKEDGKA